MTALKAHVRGGREVLDEPTELPDGTEVELTVVEDGDFAPGECDRLDATLALITSAPAAGSTYSTRSGKPHRRVLLPRTRNHVYFEADEARDLVIVHAIWGAARGRGPMP